MSTYTAFFGTQLLFRGDLADVVLHAKRHADRYGQNGLLIFSDATGKCMDFHLEGSENHVLQRIEVFTAAKGSSTIGPGRPRLGVASREVSLLPQHWEWLATQPSGTSATLRKLVEEARKLPDIRLSQDRTYRFLQAMAGDFEGYEEVLRALYRKDKKKFALLTRSWPKDVREHSMALAELTFADE